MRRSRVMEKIRAGEAIRIAMTGHVLPPFLAYAAHNGYDCIWLDMEHHPLDESEVRTMLAFAQLFDIDVLVRPNTREKMSLGRYLEDGAAGLAIPQVSTADEVRDLVSKVKYPPLGDRGMGQPNLQARYGLGAGGDHVRMADHALRETFLLVQLETPAGLANLDEMAAVPGFEGFFVGPTDLDLRMRLEPAERRVSYVDTLALLDEACRRHGLVWGSNPANVEELRAFHGMGARLLLWGVDTGLLRAGLAASAGELDEVAGARA